MLTIQASVLLCVAAVALAQLEPNLPLRGAPLQPQPQAEGQTSDFLDGRSNFLPGFGGVDQDRLFGDLNRPGFPGARSPLSLTAQRFNYPHRLGNPTVFSGDESVHSRIFDNDGNGNFRWGFRTVDGTRSEQQGTFRDPDQFHPEGVQAVQGSYSYTSPEGIPITVNYVADENGFRAVGDHIPSNANNGNPGLSFGFNNRVANNFNDGINGPLGAPVPFPAPTGTGTGGGPFSSRTPTAGYFAAQQAAALLRNPGNGNVRPAELELLAQQERLRLRNPYNLNSQLGQFGEFNSFNNVNGRFDGQNQNPISISTRPLATNGQVSQSAFNSFSGREVVGAGPGSGSAVGFQNQFFP